MIFAFLKARLDNHHRPNEIITLHCRQDFDLAEIGMLDHDIYCFSPFTRIPGRSIFAVFGNVNQKLIGTRQVVNFERKCPSDLQPLFQESWEFSSRY